MKTCRLLPLLMANILVLSASTGATEVEAPSNAPNVALVDALEQTSKFPEITDLQIEKGILEPEMRGTFLPNNFIFSADGNTEKFESIYFLGYWPQFLFKGWILDNGKRVKDYSGGPEKMTKRFAQENPGAKVVAYILAGNGSIPLEVRINEPTPVYRVTIKAGEEKTVIWLNRKEPDTIPKSSE